MVFYIYLLFTHFVTKPIIITIFFVFHWHIYLKIPKIKIDEVVITDNDHILFLF